MSDARRHCVSCGMTVDMKKAHLCTVEIIQFVNTYKASKEQQASA